MAAAPDKLKHTPASGCLIKFSLAGFGVFLTLGMVELLLRLFFPQAGRIQFIPDPVLGYRHQPGQRVRLVDEHREYAAWFSTNQHGNPDRERQTGKPGQTYRIAVVGDSMVEAAQVPEGERFTAILEQHLTEWVGKGDGPIQAVEVLNFGTSGYSTAQEWLSYRTHIRVFDPDLVLLFFLPGNDIKNNVFELEVVQSCRPEVAPFYQLDAEGNLELVNNNFFEKASAQYLDTDLPAWEKAKDKLREHIRLVSLGARAYAALRSGSITTGRAGQLEQEACQTKTTLDLFNPEVQKTDPSWQGAWQITSAILAQFAEEVTQDGAEFGVVILTGPWEIQEETRNLVLSEAEQEQYDWELPHRMAAEMLSGLDINYTVLLPAFKKAAQVDHLAVHYLYNGHYTPLGHQLLAQELTPLIQDYLDP